MIDYRAEFPDWFGDFDPSYPSWEDLHNDADATDATGALIATEMGRTEWAQPKGSHSQIVWNEHDHADAIQSLMEECRVIYFREYHDWLPRNAPMGSRWRPQERLSRNHAGQADGPNWGEFKGRGWERAEPWPDTYEADYMKPVAASGNRRPKDGIILYGLGNFRDRPVGIKPMRPVYHLINRFWRDELGVPFRPNFGDDDVLTLPPEHDNKTLDAETRARALQVNLDRINPAARFLCLALKEVDYHFDPRLCGLVARDQYRHSDTT